MRLSTLLIPLDVSSACGTVVVEGIAAPAGAEIREPRSGGEASSVDAPCGPEFGSEAAIHPRRPVAEAV
ncbi:MAG: hypothetical protein HOF43_01465 [Chloroflexi bacterium]|nr:hypothetical protein [Chloroflexota bacterium]